MPAFLKVHLRVNIIYIGNNQTTANSQAKHVCLSVIHSMRVVKGGPTHKPIFLQTTNHTIF